MGTGNMVIEGFSISAHAVRAAGRPNEAFRTGDRVVVVKDGRPCYAGRRGSILKGKGFGKFLVTLDRLDGSDGQDLTATFDGRFLGKAE